MHWITITGLIFSVISANSFGGDSRYVMLLEPIPALTRHVQPEQLVYSEEGLTILKLANDDIETWGERVHHELGGCGGFLDVTQEIESGMSAASVVWNEILQKYRKRERFSYPIVVGRDEVQELVDMTDKNAYWDFLQELTSFPNRSATTDQGVDAAKFLKSRAEQLAGDLRGFSAREVSTGFFYKQPSVVATLEGTDPSLPGVVIGGHMDTFSDQKPGADDDGSGSAVVMETLRAVAALGARFKRTIHFVWYAAEERGLVGSKYVVSDFSSKSINVHAAIQFDMVGWNDSKDSEDIYLINDYTNPELTETLRAIVGTYTDASVGDTRCGYACSDHANWHRQGIPAVFPFEASFNNMNHKLHTPDDKMGYLDIDHAHNFVKIAAAFVGELAEIE